MIAVVGPTASGKSEIAERLAGTMGGELLSVDSMQVYRGMDVGTAKPSRRTRRRVRYHLIDLVPPDAEFNVADFQGEGRAVLDALDARGVTAVIVGGSGLHHRALVDPLTFGPTHPQTRAEVEAMQLEELVAELLRADPGAGAKVDLANPRRVVRAVEILRLTGETPTQRAARPEVEALRSYRAEVPHSAVGVDAGDALEDRVVTRFDRMLACGLLEEVARLAPRLGRTARQAVGYKELLPVVAGVVSLEEGKADAIRATLALAKRQRTYFRRDPRIRWIDWDDDPAVRWERTRNVLEEGRVWTS